MASCASTRRFCLLVSAWLLAVVSPAAIALAQNGQQPSANGTPPSVRVAPGQPTASTSAPQQQGRGLFPVQPPPTDKPGFIYAFGRWWDSARGKFEDLTKQSDDAAKDAAVATQDAVQSAAQATKGAADATQDVVKGAAEATKDAAATLFRLPGMRVVEVHQRCDTAPNGAPDCRTAAINACRAKGFNAGQPVDVRSSENCPPAVWMSGREPGAGECPEETVVLMAACQ